MAMHNTKSDSARSARISPRQLAANRANAARSTGPRTDAGRHRSSLNSLKHGVLAMRAVNQELDGKQEFERYQAHRDSYFQYLKPDDQFQADLVDQIVANRWRMRKLLDFETFRTWHVHEKLVIEVEKSPYPHHREQELDAMIAADLDQSTLPSEKDATLIMRYRGSLNSEYFRAMGELRRLKKDSARNDGIYSIPADDAPAPIEAALEEEDGINSVSTEDIYQTKPNAELSSENPEFLRPDPQAADTVAPASGQSFAPDASESGAGDPV